MKQCPNCSGRIRATARRCRHCDVDVVRLDPTELITPRRVVTIAAEFAISGGLLLVSGPFLPFAMNERSSSGMLDAGEMTVAMLCAGAIAIVFGVLSLYHRKRYTFWYLPCSAAAAAATFYCQLGVDTADGHGLGLSLCYLGAFLALVAAAVSTAQRPVVPVGARLVGAASNLIETQIRRMPREVLSYREAIEKKRGKGLGN